MNRVQKYFFWRLARALGVIVAGLVLLSLIAQGLSQTDIAMNSRQSALIYIEIVLLGAPQIISLLLPLSLFVACIWSLNAIHRDSEVIVAEAGGMTRWQTLSPVLRLATLMALFHLALGLWVQPSAQRSLRESVQAARVDITTSLIRAGEFTHADDKLTFYARRVEGNALYDILISEAHGRPDAADYLAQTGVLVDVEGEVTLLLYNAMRLHKEPNGALNVLEFDQYPFDLSPFLAEERDLLLKAPDRYLGELITIDPHSRFETRNRHRFLAEAIARLTSPLYNIVMALLGVISILGGDFSRKGYHRQIIKGSLVAGGIFLLQLTVQAGAVSAPALNSVQILIPLALGAIFISLLVGKRPRLPIFFHRVLRHAPVAAE